MFVLAVAAACTLAGARTFREVGDQAADLPQNVLRELGGRPHPLLRKITAPSEILHYRRGLDIERRESERTTSLSAYREALEHFERAARIDPANMLVQLHRGTLLELTGAHAEAVELYRKCSRLWPEHIEVLYRLSTAYKEVTGGAAFPYGAEPAGRAGRPPAAPG